MAEHTVFCRVCYHLCGSIVEIDDATGRPVSMRGDKENPLYKGYACVKGRASPAMHNSADRLLYSVKRQPDGSFERIDVELAMDEIAAKLKSIMTESGARSIGAYYGTGTVGGTFVMPFTDAFFRSIGSPMVFGSESIDQPGKTIAKGLHGMWMAPSNGWVEPEAILLIGVNPLRSAKSGNWMRNNLFGTIIPDAMVERMEKATDPAAEGRKICVEYMEELATIPGVAGAHIMAPGNDAAVPDVIREARGKIARAAA